MLNFAALGIGGLFTGDGVASQWYSDLTKAPWTPPGWVFGFAWTTIMICFSLYMTNLWRVNEDKRSLVLLFSTQWILNVSWNPLFFYWHQVELALVSIVLLTLNVAGFIIRYTKLGFWNALLILPYLLWLVVATSLNAYIFLTN